MEPNEVIVSVHIPFTRPLEFVRAFKQSRRRDDGKEATEIVRHSDSFFVMMTSDIAIVNACFRVLLEEDKSRSGGHKIKEFSVAYGGGKEKGEEKRHKGKERKKYLWLKGEG